MTNDYFDEAGYKKAVAEIEGFAKNLNSFMGLAKQGSIKILDSDFKKAVQLRNFEVIEDAYKAEIAEGLPQGVTVSLEGEIWPQLRTKFKEIARQYRLLENVGISRGKASLPERQRAALKESFTHQADERTLRLYKALEGAIAALEPLREFGTISDHPFNDHWINLCIRDRAKNGQSVRMINQERCAKVLRVLDSKKVAAIPFLQ